MTTKPVGPNEALADGPEHGVWLRAWDVAEHLFPRDPSRRLEESPPTATEQSGEVAEHHGEAVEKSGKSTG